MYEDTVMYRTVTYELLALEAWFITGKRPNRALLVKIRTEVIRIREALLTGVISLTEDTHVQRYVRTHHFGIIQLLNKLNAKQSLESHTSLLELLNIIESRFSIYVEPDADLCNFHRTELVEQCQQVMAVSNGAFERSGISKELVMVYNHAFRSVTNGRTTTYRQRTYMQTLIQELKDWISKDASHNLEETLATILLSLNLNSSHALRYWQTRISDQLSSKELNSEKRENLIALQRSISQVSVAQSRYNPVAPPLHEQVLNHVVEETDRLPRQSFFPAKGTIDTIPESFRVRTELSVSQLACFVKSLVDNRIIVNPNISELLRFFAQTIVSKRAEVISFDSLRAKYYNIESGTKDALRQTLQTILKTLS